jgi:hypothetical protein
MRHWPPLPPLPRSGGTSEDPCPCRHTYAHTLTHITLTHICHMPYAICHIIHMLNDFS